MITTVVRPLSRVQIDTITTTDDLPGDWVLWASYINTINVNTTVVYKLPRLITQSQATGWGQLEIHSNPDVADSYQAYFAGFVEGYLTSKLIEAHFYNLLDGYCDHEETYCQKVSEYLENNLR